MQYIHADDVTSVYNTALAAEVFHNTFGVSLASFLNNGTKGKKKGLIQYILNIFNIPFKSTKKRRRGIEGNSSALTTYMVDPQSMIQLKAILCAFDGHNTAITEFPY